MAGAGALPCSSRTSFSSSQFVSPTASPISHSHVISFLCDNDQGDVLSVSQLAGIMGAKQTATLIPLCHPLLLSHVDAVLRLNDQDEAVDIEATVKTVGPTGVEMEALTAVSVAALTVYDMCKAASKDIRITDVFLVEKLGGKSGHWRYDA